MRSVRASTGSARTVPVVAALGIFDGVHRGHRKILEKAAQRARRLHGTALAVTFDPHPLVILRPQAAPPMLLSLENRLEAFTPCGIRAALVIPFTRSFSRWSPERFAGEVLVKTLGVREVVVGHDFRFGADRAGTPETLREIGRRHGFRVWVAAPVRVGKERVSSRRIRGLITAGDLRRAARLLGRPVSVTGRVVQGAGRGLRLGFATANLKIESGLLPPVGVYAVAAQLFKKGTVPFGDCPLRVGMANLGFRPTFKKTEDRGQRTERNPLLEVHLFGVQERLYGKSLQVRFLKRLRDERKFTSAEALRLQLEQDAHRAGRVFALHAGKRMV